MCVRSKTNLVCMLILRGKGKFTEMSNLVATNETLDFTILNLSDNLLVEILNGFTFIVIIDVAQSNYPLSSILPYSEK